MGPMLSQLPSPIASGESEQVAGRHGARPRGHGERGGARRAADVRGDRHVDPRADRRSGSPGRSRSPTPAGTVTLGGTLAAAGWLLESGTDNPPAGAAAREHDRALRARAAEHHRGAQRHRVDRRRHRHEADVARAAAPAVEEVAVMVNSGALGHRGRGEHRARAVGRDISAVGLPLDCKASPFRSWAWTEKVAVSALMMACSLLPPGPSRKCGATLVARLRRAARRAPGSPTGPPTRLAPGRP